MTSITDSSHMAVTSVSHIPAVGAVTVQPSAPAVGHHEEERVNRESLKLERAKASFNIRQMTYLLDKGQAETELIETVYRQLERDPVFADDMADLPIPEQKRQVMLRLKRLVEYKESDDPKTYEARLGIIAFFDTTLFVRYSIHSILFIPALIQNGTDEQVAKWLPDAEKLKVTGCFAMTEMGHGSYVQGLETTATFDKERDEFVINTPTETATKWWIGGAARINIGDCGAKMGRNGLDNGWIQYSNVRIPRQNMLMRHASLSRDGKYSRPPSSQIAYGPLVLGRVGVTAHSVSFSKVALTIAIRYGAVRRQFPDPQSSNNRECPILDYATHKWRLMPLLAETLAQHFTVDFLRVQVLEMLKRLKEGDFSLLNDLHPTVAGFKSFITWFTLMTIEQCRQACGGHGYSAYSGLPSMFNDFGVMCTWEGDNTVMAQQTARYLIKSWQNASDGKQVTGSVQYFMDAKKTLADRLGATQKESLLDPSYQLRAYKYCATNAIKDAHSRLRARMEAGLTLEKAWNDTTVELVGAAKAHCYYYMTKASIDAVQKISDPNIKSVMKTAIDLYVWSSMRRFFEFSVGGKFFSSEEVVWIKELVGELCDQLRQQAVPITDAFNFSDFILRSPLGYYDGNVYRHYFDRVKRAPNAQGRPFYWEEAIKPLHLPEKSKL